MFSPRKSFARSDDRIHPTINPRAHCYGWLTRYLGRALSDHPTSDCQTTAISQLFHERFEGEPAAIAAAPGRVNVIGEHTDYNGGFVLPMALNRTCRMAAAPNASNEIVIYSAEREEELKFSLCELEPQPQGNFADYVRGVVAGFCQTGASVSGFNAAISSDVPLGAGLSSSAALEVATATVLEGLLNRRLAPLEKALLCQKAEQDYVGVPCGLMDQYSSVFGSEDHLVLLDCQNNQSELVAFDDPAIEMLVVNTNVMHKLADSEYAVRRQTCESAAGKLGVESLRAVIMTELETHAGKLTETEFQRARHVISENERTTATVQALRQKDWRTAGKHMYRSHDSLRDDYEVSCTELDTVVDICRAIGEAGGVFGARMTGGGFGGCAIALIRTADAGTVRDRITREYVERTEIQPSVFAVRPGSGARPLPW